MPPESDSKHRHFITERMAESMEIPGSTGNSTPEKSIDNPVAGE
jgi:hypothetical protein